jgi:hypothetical protein
MHTHTMGILTSLVDVGVLLPVVLDAQGGHHLPSQDVEWSELGELGGVRSCLPPPQSQWRSVGRCHVVPVKHSEGVIPQSDARAIMGHLALGRVLGDGIGSVELEVRFVHSVGLDLGLDAKGLPDADSARTDTHPSARAHTGQKTFFIHCFAFSCMT